MYPRANFFLFDRIYQFLFFRGIVPITCDELFKIIEGDTGSGTVSIEIKNVGACQVKDL